MPVNSKVTDAALLPGQNRQLRRAVVDREVYVQVARRSCLATLICGMTVFGRS